MKRFILRILFYSTVSGILIVIALLWSSSIVRSNAQFKIPENVKTIVLGHSHPAEAYNDSLIEDFGNYANVAEAYFYTYFKMIQILDQNPNINTVLVEYTNDQINEERNRRIWGTDMSKRFKVRYGP